MIKRFLINIAISVYVYLFLLEAIYVLYYKKMEHLLTVISMTLFMLLYWIVRRKYKHIYMPRKKAFISIFLFILYAVYFYTDTDIYSPVVTIYLLIVFSIPNTLFVLLLHKYNICTDYFYNEVKMFGENSLPAAIYCIGAIMQTDSILPLFILLSHTTTVIFFIFKYLMADD